MDGTVEDFCAITGATPQVGRHFMTMTDNDVNQAIQLFFDSPDLGSAMAAGSSQAPPVPPASTRPPARNIGRTDSEGVVHLDSDDDDELMDDFDDQDVANTSHSPPAATAAAVSHGGTYEDDEAMARRMQEELYAGGDMAGDYDADGVRAPMQRTTETLVGPGADYNVHDAVLDQLRQRAQPRSRTRPNLFNQQPASSSSSIWEEGSTAAQRDELARLTGGASEASSKAVRLAELFRPPFELISRLSWEEARQEGKEELKWLLVNVQDPSIFDCQSLNRDIWKHEGIKETVKENFIFLQYSKDDPRGAQYIQYYFPQHENDSAYPHIAIVDPRTGEQVKVWSGPPAPKPMDFLMQLHEFLDRYSLNLEARNPVAKRKPEKPAGLDVGRLTEEQMLEIALQNSLSNGNSIHGPREHDPDDLTKSVGDLGKGKGKSVEGVDEDMSDSDLQAATSPFGAIPSNNPHAEPAQDPATVTRIQFRHPEGRIIRRFNVSDPVQRIYEWLKAEPLNGNKGVEFELKMMGKDLINHLNESISEAGLKNGTVMIEYLED